MTAFTDRTRLRDPSAVSMVSSPFTGPAITSPGVDDAGAAVVLVGHELSKLGRVVGFPVDGRRGDDIGPGLGGECARQKRLPRPQTHGSRRREARSSPAKLLARLRMEAACTLLEGGARSVKQVAGKSGFGSEYNLRRAFAAHLGVRPSEYHARFG